MKRQFLIIIIFLISFGLWANQNNKILGKEINRSLVGLWNFDDAENLTQATVGNDLELVGTQTAVAGPEVGDGAVNIGVGSFYRCFHDIPANGEGNQQWVNIYSVVMDVRISQLNQWYCFEQTNYENNDDGDWFINPNGQIGVGATGYSSYAVQPNEWYRLAISVNLGNHYDYYLDGQLLFNGEAQDLDGRFALYPANNGNQVLFFADNNGEDNAIDVARIMLFDHDLNATEIEELGGFGHEIETPELMSPYLQTPTPNSIYVCWQTDNSTQSTVEYGTTEELGQTETGDVYVFNSTTIWHWVKLTNLQPQTEYFYRCISDSDTTSVKIFRTQPPADLENGHIRFIVYGDSRTDFVKHAQIIHAIRDKVVELYGENVRNELNLVINVGDIVTYGWTLSQYLYEYFSPISSLSDEVPFMVSIGNHEMEADYFYDYMKYEDFGGAQGEKYYSFRIGAVLFIAVNSNVQGETQLNWLETQLDQAENNTEIDWIFIFNHHPGHTEIWPEGNTSWVQNTVIPLLSQYDKAELYFYGHSHDYERGIAPNGNLRMILTGGGGAALDRWGMYDNQTDYPEIQCTFDYYNYVLVDVDLANHSYTAKTYSLGNLDVPQNNILLEEFDRYRDAEKPETPIGLSPAGVGSEQPILVASPFTADFPLMCSQFQLNDNQHNWVSPLVDEVRFWENIYGDSGAPDFIPTDLNENIDLKRLPIEAGILENGTTYFWKVRYRDQNLKWSDWSEIQNFTVTQLPENADFTADVLQGTAPLEVRFTDISTGNAIAWEWDLNGDGTIDSNEQDPTWIYENVGSYSVSLTVDFGNQQLTETKENYITIEPESVEINELQPVENSVFNSPNPFQSSTTISFQFSNEQNQQNEQKILSIYNIKGQRIRTLECINQVDAKATESLSHITWDGKDENGNAVDSGIYLYKLKIGKEIFVKKIVLEK